MVDPISGFVLKVLGNVLDKIATDLVRSAMDRAIGGKPVREIAPGNVKRAIDRAANQLVELRPATLPDNEWRAAVAAVRDSLEAVRPIDIDLVLDAGADPLHLNEQLRARTAHIKRRAALDPAAQHAYDRVLSASCGHIIDLVRSLPDFDRLLQSRTLQGVDRIEIALRDIPDQIDRKRESEFLEFEREYTRHVAENIKFELFGVTRGRAPKKQSFEDSYVSLAVARSARDESDVDQEESELTGAGIGAANAFADYTRVLLRGGAGTGKTTLLRWLTVQAARGSLRREINGWSDAVPFFLPLRQFASSPLPTPEQFPHTVARIISGNQPDRWVDTRFTGGRALLLVDGIDELPSERRTEIKEWLDELVTRYPRARYVVTTRPFAVEGDWLAESGFVTFDLLPLSAKGIRDLLTCWHNAARSEYEFDEDKQAWLNKCESTLAELLSTRSDLRKLAASPLLCGLLCALYQDGNMHLPRDRKSLYEAALDLLLVRWDEQRRLTVGAGLPLDKEEQLMLLQVFAYSLVKNSQNSLGMAEATKRFTHGMRGIRPNDASPETVLRHMLERTGLLLEPYPDQVEFVHRTFRDYLAAREVVDCGDYNLLVQNAHLDQWHDVVVMAVAKAPRLERDKVLEALLRGNDEARGNDRIRDRLHLVAAACLEQTSVVDSEEVRRRVHEAAARLIPPANPDEAEVLAKAGPFVLDLLPGPERLSDAQAAWIVRTIAAIGGEGAADKIAAFKDLDESIVIEELLRAWRQSDSPEEYARTVLADVDFRDRQLDVRSYHRAQQLRHLRRLRNVRCRGDLRDLSVFAEVPLLRRLELMTNELVRDLGPLAQCQQLRTLRLTFCLELRDLSPLAGTTVEELALHTMRVDLATLRGARLRMLSIRDHAIDDGLHPLPDELPLRELAVDNRPPYRNLLGIERWQTLERVSVFGVPTEDEVTALTSLPAMDRLVVTGPESAQQLRQLERLTALHRLDVNNLDGLASGERDAVLLVLRNLPYEVHLNGQPLDGNS